MSSKKGAKEENRKRLNLSVTIDEAILKEFKSHCRIEFKNASRLVESFLERYLNENKRK